MVTLYDRITKKEAEQIARTVMAELEAIQPGCTHTIVGGHDPLLLFYAEAPDSCHPSSYRRGKSESNDVDIVVTHPNADKKRIRELCQQLTEVLSEKGLVTHVMSESEHHLTSMHCATLTRYGNAALTGQNTPKSSHSDVLAKALTVFSLPRSNKSSRLDLIFAVPEVYWTAVVGWYVIGLKHRVKWL